MVFAEGKPPFWVRMKTVFDALGNKADALSNMSDALNNLADNVGYIVEGVENRLGAESIVFRMNIPLFKPYLL